jgi:phosphoesterase RecJ-like protein
MQLADSQKKALFKTLKEKIDGAERIIIVMHQRPDGDALGSALALSEYLNHLQKVHDVFCIHPAPEHYQFLPNVQSIKTDASLISEGNHDVIICLDSGDLRYAGIDEHVSKRSAPYTMINFDHHATNAQYGHINIVDDTASSTSELLYHFLSHHNHPITNDVATCILTGIITDTGGFSNLATTSISLDVASKLLALGARIWDIQNFTAKNKPISALKAWGIALSRLEKHSNGVVTTVLTQQDIKDTSASPESIEGIANFLNSVEDARAIFVIREEEDGNIKVSMRSTHEDVDVSRLARHFGGGGHKKAAGFTVVGKLAKTDSRWQII